MKLVLFLAVLVNATLAKADVVYSQTSPNGNSFDITDYRLADDFTLPASATIGEVQFWYQAQYQTDLTAVTWAFYADNAGMPGSVLDSGTVTSPLTGFDTASGFFFADVPAGPLALADGSRYWLELHAGTSLTDTAGLTVSWAAVDDNSTLDAQQNLLLGIPETPVGFSGYNQYAFELSSTTAATPEPSLRLLLLLSIAALAAFQMVKRIRPTKTSH